MIHRGAGLWWCALGVAFGCGGSNKANPDAAHDPIDASSVDAAALLAWPSEVADYQTGSGIAGAQVCVPTNSEVACATTDGSGDFTLEFPVSRTANYYAASAIADGYLEAVVLGEDDMIDGLTTVGGSSPFLMTSDFATQLLGSDAGFTVPSSTTGYLFVRATSSTPAGIGPVAGATATISSAATIVYADGSGNPDRALGSTSETGGIYFGGVTPGQVSVTVTSEGVQCISDGSNLEVVGVWPPTGSASVDAYVVAGAITENVNVFCP
jgi:hypothetical protein